MSDDHGEEAADDPFACPSCGGDVVCRGDGAKDCKRCTWQHRPPKPSKQTGLKDY